MSVETDEKNDAFELVLKLAGLDAPRAMRITRDGAGVRVMISLDSLRQVHAWAKQMGVEAVTDKPVQYGGATSWWYRYTCAAISAGDLYFQVAAVQMALDPDVASMTEPVTP